MRTYFPVLSIAGSDSSGGAGIQADIKTISALGCYAMTAITALTAQNTCGVTDVMPASASIVTAQIDTVTADITPLAVKIGMLCNASVADAVAAALERLRLPNIVLDPVMISTSGSVLLEPEAVKCITERLFPLADIVTPNLSEARALSGTDDPDAQARALRAMGCRAILIKGGDADTPDFKTDLLYPEGSLTPIELRADAVDTPNTHGTGCTLSSAIASWLALGCDIPEAVSRAKLYVTEAIRQGAFVTTGRGHGPVNHFYSPRRLKNFNPRRHQ